MHTTNLHSTYFYYRFENCTGNNFELWTNHDYRQLFVYPYTLEWAIKEFKSFWRQTFCVNRKYTGSPEIDCFLNLTLTDRNMQAKFGLKGVLELRDVDIFDTTTSDDACHLWSNLKMSNLFCAKKEFECTECKAIFINFFCTFWGFFWCLFVSNFNWR